MFKRLVERLMEHIKAWITLLRISLIVLYDIALSKRRTYFLAIMVHSYDSQQHGFNFLLQKVLFQSKTVSIV